MARDLNKVMVIGRLGRDPEMRYTPGGSPVTTFTVAASRQWKDGQGETHEETEWFNIVSWNKLAEICKDYLHKASRVYIEGRLQTRQWQGQDGQNHYRTEVIATDMIMLDNRSYRDHTTQDSSEQRPSTSSESYGRTPDITDEDIPF